MKHDFNASPQSMLRVINVAIHVHKAAFVIGAQSRDLLCVQMHSEHAGHDLRSTLMFACRVDKHSRIGLSLAISRV